MVKLLFIYYLSFLAAILIVAYLVYLLYQLFWHNKIIARPVWTNQKKIKKHFFAWKVQTLFECGLLILIFSPGIINGILALPSVITNQYKEGIFIYLNEGANMPRDKRGKTGRRNRWFQNIDSKEKIIFYIGGEMDRSLCYKIKYYDFIGIAEIVSKGECSDYIADDSSRTENIESK